MITLQYSARNRALRNLSGAFSRSCEVTSSSFSTSASSSQSKGKAREVTHQESTQSITSISTSDLSESIKALMRVSAQSVGVITSYVEQSMSSSTSSGSSSKPQEHGQSGSVEERSVHGATLSSFTTVSLEPPIVAFSLRTPSRLADALLSPIRISEDSRSTSSRLDRNISHPESSNPPRRAHFVINILSSTQSPIASSFAKPGLRHYSQKEWKAPSVEESDSVVKKRMGEGQHPLDIFPHQPSETAGGVPFLTESVGALACSIVRKLDLDHFDELTSSREGTESKKSDGSQLFLARVHAVEGTTSASQGEKLPLVYWKQKFCTIGEEV